MYQEYNMKAKKEVKVNASLNKESRYKNILEVKKKRYNMIIH